MSSIVRRFRTIFILVGSFVLAGAAAIAALTCKHLMDTPQPLESALAGEARLYRWRSCHVFYTVLGSSENPPIVLLHNPDIGASSYEMRFIMEKLAQRYCVYAPDLPGFGLSDRLNMDYAVETYTDFCHDFLTEVVQTAQQGRSPATLLASGRSCTYAITIAHNYPELCAQLVLISPVGLSGTSSLPRAFASMLRLPLFGLSLYTLCSTRFALRRVLARHNPQYGGGQEILRDAQNDRWRRDAQNDRWRRDAQNDRWRRDAQSNRRLREWAEVDMTHLYAATHRFGAEHALLALWSGKLSRDVRQQFAELRQPVLLIQGTQTLHNNDDASNEQPEQTQLAIMHDAGVYVHEQYPDVIITDILDWSDVNRNSTIL